VTGAHRPCVAFRTCESLMHGIDGVEIAALVGPIVCPKPMVRRVPAAYPLGVYSFPFSAGRLNLHYVKPRFLPICVLHRPRLISAAARPTCSYVEFGRQCASYAHDVRAALVGARPTSSQVKTFFFFLSLLSQSYWILPSSPTGSHPPLLLAIRPNRGHRGGRRWIPSPTVMMYPSVFRCDQFSLRLGLSMLLPPTVCVCVCVCVCVRSIFFGGSLPRSR